MSLGFLFGVDALDHFLHCVAFQRLARPTTEYREVRRPNHCLVRTSRPALSTPLVDPHPVSLTGVLGLPFVVFPPLFRG